MTQLKGRRNWMHTRIWTRKSISDGEPILKVLSEDLPEAFPAKWGDVASMHVRASASNFKDAAAFWKISSRVCGRTIHGSDSSNSLIVAFLCGTSGRTHDLNFEFNPLKVTKGAIGHRALRLFSRWIEMLDADFGRLCMDEEWITKNVVEQYKKPDGGINPWKVFGTNIIEGLPGVYWCTFLGKVFSDWLGPRKVAQAPWPHVRQLAGGYLLRRSDSPESWRTEADLDAKLKQYFGPERFFDINQPERKIEAPRIEVPLVGDNGGNGTP
jgi:hypothetical protein